MKKTIALVFGGFIIGALVSPVAGMAISSTRSLILGMAPQEAILVLADKIDEESGKNDIQEQSLNELNNSKLQQEEQLSRLAKNQEIATCNEKHNNCETKINTIINKGVTLANGTISTGDRQEAIKQIESSIKSCKNDRDSGEFKGSTVLDAMDNCIKRGEKDIVAIKNAITSETTEKNNLLNGECKDYQNPCE